MDRPDRQNAQAGQTDRHDYAAFKELASEVAPIRSKRRVSVETFTKMASEPNTVILDTRSKRDYEDRHIKGALHIDFADLNEATLREAIPDPNTRVLIYCVNNFVSMQEVIEAQDRDSPAPRQKPVAPARTRVIDVPDEYKTVSKRVMVTPPTTTSKRTPDRYDTVRVRKMVEPPKERSVSDPAEYTEVKRQKLVAPARTRMIDVPAKYKTESKRVMVTPPTATSSRYKTVRVHKTTEPTKEHSVSVPAEYKTVTRQKLVSPARTRAVDSPAEYKTIEVDVEVSPGKFEKRESRVMVTPPAKRVETIPAKWETVTEKVLVKPANSRVEGVAPRFDFAEEEVRPKPAEPTYDTSVALNVPTYISLTDYGYKDVFELGPAVSWHSPRLQFGGTSTVNSPAISAEADMAMQRSAAKSEHVDFEAFVSATEKHEALWRQRLVSAEEFGQMAKEPNTLILDARSQAAFERKRFQKAVHLNFSEFSQKELARVIPSLNTRILLYCDSNLASETSSTPAHTALSLPTFIQLITYGYPDVYVLNETVPESSALLAGVNP